MTHRIRRRLVGYLSVCGLMLVALPTAAQERMFLRLPTEVTTPRAVGLGGALAGLGGDAAAMAGNPASLIAVPRSLDVTVAGGNRGGFTVGIAAHPLATLAFGVLLPAFDQRLPLVPIQAAAATDLRPRDGRYIGAGIAWKPDRRVALGVLGEWQHLCILGGATDERRSWFGWSAGLYVQPDNPDGTRLGLSYRKGTNEGFTDDPLDPVRVQRPDIFSFGVAWRYAWLKNTRLILALQPDLVRYPKALGVGRNEFDLRAGIEAWFPFGRCVSGCGGLVQVRAGVVSRSAIPTISPRGGGSYDPGQRSTGVAVGASLAPEVGGGKFKADVSYSWESHGWLAGLSYRFPTAFRGDLQHHRVRK